MDTNRPYWIRPATPGDVATIERIVKDAYTHYITRIGATPGPMRDDYRARVAQDVVHVLDTQAGVQGLIVLIPEPDSGCMLLDNIAVSSLAQGRGYGREMLRWAEDVARQAGFACIRLYTQEMMTENIAIYLRYGYVETHRAREIGLNRVFMRKPLI
ncbi:GNAT family N-acetyltransferase [Achromobacter deleyi]|uniref:GNAT family N-acetyltransferase n=1 Tax=Achromobacter deleyi TaxID=1353891 RepID=UPI0014927617|nr:GNAT family N-acetyltransferase [Achromobacter deleyi]QVQ25466.1 GNAT family N-acetyltransferase [Achromobacter deleyi]UIP21009.1 GNAT family N-acetyltransferase [Achromobacter deleyi]